MLKVDHRDADKPLTTYPTIEGLRVKNHYIFPNFFLINALNLGLAFKNAISFFVNFIFTMINTP